MNTVQLLLLGGLAAWLLRPWEWRGRERQRPTRSRPHRVSRASGGDLASQLERGEITGSALRDLMASGQLRLKRNPEEHPVDASKLTPAERRQLNAAKRLARQFHGEDYEVVELDPDERKLPRFLPVLGRMPTLEYEPSPGSKRAGYVYEHESGDRGFGQKASPNAPLLAADPKTRRPVIVPLRSPVRFSGKVGLVG